MMDTSKEYIKMCEKAEEIRDNWHPSIGDEIGEYSINHGYGYTGLLQVEEYSFEKIDSKTWRVTK